MPPTTTILRKFAQLSGTVFISILLAGLYGVIHDQITYSISPEYFTKFKFRQFGFEPEWFGGDRPTVALIGFFATWWTGIFIGFTIGLIAVFRFNGADTGRHIRKALFIVFITAVVIGFAGYVYGTFAAATQTRAYFTGWHFPPDLVDPDSYVRTGSVHNFSYAGGLVGLVIACIYLLRRNKKEISENVSNQPQ